MFEFFFEDPSGMAVDRFRVTRHGRLPMHVANQFTTALNLPGQRCQVGTPWETEENAWDSTRNNLYKNSLLLNDEPSRSVSKPVCCPELNRIIFS